MTTQPLHTKLRELTAQAKDLFGVEIPVPTIKWYSTPTPRLNDNDTLLELMGVVAYGATNTNTKTIYLNGRVSMKDIVEKVLPHEYAHLIDSYINKSTDPLVGRVGSHDDVWEDIVARLGYNVAELTGHLELQS